MMLAIPDVLTTQELVLIRETLAAAPWIDGRATAGYQSMTVKNNRQLAMGSPEAIAMGKIIVEALPRSARFSAAALPQYVYPPLFNRYDVGMGFGDHIDNAIRGHIGDSGGRLRTDLSATLFLCDPSEYDGGELVVGDTYGRHGVKLKAGHLILYPSSSVHRVMPITRGSRLASFFWIQSMIREDARRGLLYDMDLALGSLRERGMNTEPEMVALNGVYHNLIRMWADIG